MKWYCSFWGKRWIVDIIFPKISFDVWYQFFGSCLIVFISSQKQSACFRLCCTFRASSLSNLFDHSAQLCLDSSAYALSHCCYVGRLTYTRNSRMCLLSPIFSFPSTGVGGLCQLRLQNPKGLYFESHINWDDVMVPTWVLCSYWKCQKGSNELCETVTRLPQ